jgi:hypothetical protein
MPREALGQSAARNRGPVTIVEVEETGAKENTAPVNVFWPRFVPVKDAIVNEASGLDACCPRWRLLTNASRHLTFEDGSPASDRRFRVKAESKF